MKLAETAYCMSVLANISHVGRSFPVLTTFHVVSVNLFNTLFESLQEMKRACAEKSGHL